MSSSYTFGLFLGAIVTRVPRARNILSYWMRILLLAFAGVSVPVSYWPGAVEALSNILPVTHGLAASRLLLDSGSATDIVSQAFYALVVSLAWLLLALLIIDRMANAGRRDGSIEFVT
jgi:ABC-2 type transport system permease protein